MTRQHQKRYIHWKKLCIHREKVHIRLGKELVETTVQSEVEAGASCQEVKN